jgi:hypothetical protein
MLPVFGATASGASASLVLNKSAHAKYNDSAPGQVCSGGPKLRGFMVMVTCVVVMMMVSRGKRRTGKHHGK